MASGQMPEFRAGDWACSLCSNHNFASKSSCNRCGAPKMGGAAPGKGGGFGGYGKGLSYGGGAKGGGAKGGGAPRSGGALTMRPGDWCCPQCYNHNYADKMACFRCGVPKIPHMHGSGGYSMMGKGGYGYGSERRPGDWKCYGCGNNNYASRTEACNRCNLAKTVYVSKSGMRPGDWICPTCQNHNWAGRAFCLKCQSPKAGSQVHMKGMRRGDWLCSQCNNHNYASKDRCNRCQCPKQVGAITMASA